MTLDPQRAKSIFLAALSSAGENRGAFLDEACAGDPELRRRVDRLLQAHDRPDSLPETPAAAGPTEDSAPQHRRPPAPGLVAAEGPGTVIGPYKLLQQLGEGGMGTVWMAEQTRPVQRKVALKVIKSGMDSKQVIARFEAERQALAMMDHVNIARVFDGGTTENGRPYFVMELVHGVPITKYCDDNLLTPRERLELFVPVCQAIQHAHQKGIIHRDVKPSNVMITLYDGKPVPKVIDFGVAKATEQKLTERTLFTQYGTLVGTLEYMSPEQAEMSALGVDTRSDIYSLGVLLYELLTGSTPLTHKRMKEAAYAEILRMIKEEEPPKPSTRLSDSGAALASISANRHTEPAKLTKLMRGELDWIVMKTLEKDRNRRYETAKDFAADVQRYLNDEPVQACPPSAMYRLRKFARRNKVAMTTSVLVTAALVLGTAISTWQAIRATQAEKDARQAQQAEVEARERAEALAEKDRHFAYAPRINLVSQAWERQDLARMRQLLEDLQPRAGEQDLRGFEWHYLWRLASSDRFPLPGHVANVTGVAYSPDGKKLATAADDGLVMVWDATTSQRLLTLRGHSDRVTSVGFSPNGNYLVSSSFDHTVRLWDASTGKQLYSFRGHLSVVGSVVFSPDGQRLASSGGDQTVRVWNVKTRLEMFTIKEHTDRVRSVTFSPDGRRLATGSFDRTARVWDADTGRQLHQLSGHTGGVWTVAFNPDGTLLASASFDGTVKVWDATTGRELLTFREHTGQAVHGVAFSPDGTRLASCGIHGARGVGSVKVWDPTTGTEQLNLNVVANSLAFAPDGNRLACSSNPDYTARVWDVRTGRELLILPGDNAALLRHRGAVRSVAFSPDGQQLASGSVDGTVAMWDVPTGQKLRTLGGDSGPIWSVAMSPDGQRLATGNDDCTVRVYDPRTGEERLALKGHTAKVRSVAFSPDGQRLASASYDRTVRVWDAHSGRELVSIENPTQMMAVAFSSDGQRLAARAIVDAVTTWDGATRQMVFSVPGLSMPDNGVAFSPDGERLASVGARTGEERMVFVWNARTGQELLTLRGGTRCVSFSPDGRRLIGAIDDRYVALWDSTTGQLLLTLRGHTGPVYSVAVSPDGTRIASGSEDGTVRVWDATPMAEPRSPSAPFGR